MKVRVTKPRRNFYWYSYRIGQVFEVDSVDSTDYYVKWNDDRYGEERTGCIWLTDAEIVEENKIVEHDGVKYKVPSYATYLARDSTGKGVFFFENEPIWYNDRIGWAHAEGTPGRIGVAEVYVEPKPDGNFIVKI